MSPWGLWRLMWLSLAQTGLLIQKAQAAPQQPSLSAAGASNNPEEIRRDLGKQHVSEGWWALPQTVPFPAADQALLLMQHTSSCPLIL